MHIIIWISKTNQVKRTINITVQIYREGYVRLHTNEFKRHYLKQFKLPDSASQITAAMTTTKTKSFILLFLQKS